MVTLMAVPTFALANAGIAINGHFLAHAYGSPITLGIVIGYVAGKPVGIVGASWLVTRVSRVRSSRVSRWLPWTVAGLGVAAGVAGFVVRRGTAPQPIRFTIPIRAGVTFDVTRSNITVSPDGSRIVYSASPGGLFQLYMRTLGDDESRPISGMDASVYPFFSYRRCAALC